MTALIATLIGSTARPLTPLDVAAITGHIAQHQAVVTGQDWLCPFEACDVTLEDESGVPLAATLPRLRNALYAYLHPRGFDAVVQAAGGNRRKKALFADMESTLIKEEMLEELADTLGLRAPVQRITTRAMNGELDFRAALAARMEVLQGVPAATVEALVARMTVNPGAAALVATMRAAGAHCVLVSGGFRIFTRALAAQLGFHAEHGNQLDIAEGKITGRLVEPLLDKHRKQEIMAATLAAQGLAAADSLAVGDGANDLPMLLAAGLGIAYHAKPAVQAEAPHRLKFADLRGLLWAQGYRAAEVKQE